MVFKFFSEHLESDPPGLFVNPCILFLVIGFAFSYKFKLNNWQQFVHLPSFLYTCSVACDGYIVDNLIRIINSDNPGRVPICLFFVFISFITNFFIFDNFSFFWSVPNWIFLRAAVLLYIIFTWFFFQLFAKWTSKIRNLYLHLYYLVLGTLAVHWTMVIRFDIFRQIDQFRFWFPHVLKTVGIFKAELIYIFDFGIFIQALRFAILYRVFVFIDIPWN